MCQFKTAPATEAPHQAGDGCCRCQCDARLAALGLELARREDENGEVPAAPSAAEAGDALTDRDSAISVSRSSISSISSAATSVSSRVRFADDHGQSLTEVRVFESENPSEFSDSDDELSFTTEGADEMDDEEERSFAKDAPTLITEFATPSIERAVAALKPEGADVAEDIQLAGLWVDIRARCVGGLALAANLRAERAWRRVFVRVSLDGGTSYEDLTARKVQGLAELPQQRELFAFRLPMSLAGGLDLSARPLEFEFRLGCQSLLEEHGEEEGAGASGVVWGRGGLYRAQLAPPRPRATFCIESSDEEDDYY